MSPGRAPVDDGLEVSGRWGDPGMLHRPRVMARLERVAQRRLVLIRAPAGAGKTTLLRQWAQRLTEQGEPPVHLAMYEGEEPSALWWRLIRAAGETGEPWSDGLAALQPPFRPDAMAGFIRRLVAIVAATQRPLRLLIDDLHHIRDEQTLAAVQLFVESGPPGLHIVATAREELQLPVNRWRLGGIVADLGAPEIDLTVEETETLLASYGLQLPDDAVRRIVERTEGWMGGTRLVIAALRSQGSTAALALEKVLADDRAVAAYLLEQVVDDLDAGDQEFLLLTCVVDELPIELADRLSGGHDSAARLRALAHHVGFVATLAGPQESYRYHAMLLQTLRHQLAARPAAVRNALHATASDWYLAQGAVALAVQHAQRAGDYARAARVLREHYLARWVHGEAGQLSALVDQLPLDILSDDPELAALAAFAEAAIGRVKRLDAYLRIAEHGAAATGDPAGRRTIALAIAAVRVGVARGMGRSAEVIEIASRVPTEFAVADHPHRRADRHLAAVIASCHGTALCWTGDFAAARVMLRSGESIAQRADAPLVELNCRAMAALVDALEGRIRAARTAAEQLILHATVRGWAGVTQLIGAYLALAVAAQEADEPVVATEALAAFTPWRESAPQSCGARLATVLEARQRLREGRPRQAAEMLRAFDTTSPDRADVVGFDHLVRRARLEADNQAGEPGTERFRARITAELAEGRAVPRDGSDLLIRTRLWAAWAAHLDGDTARRDADLSEALTLAADEGYRLPFTELGPQFSQVLVEASLDPKREALASRMLTRYWPDASPGVVLSVRQAEVLAALAGPYTLPDIAAQLHVSLNTVKFHVRAIYARLGARNRNQAVRIGREKRLLPSA